MPHLILEASANIMETNDKFKQSLRDLQSLLVEKLPTQLDNCKSRVIIHDLFVLGDDNSNNAFIHLTVKILQGRSPELLAEISHQLQEILKINHTKSREHLNLSISVEICELSSNYAK